ncbi:MAG: hypothetical protein ACLSHX_17795 [Suilimivivens sp.]
MVEAGKLHFESGVLYAEKYYRYEHEAAKALAALLMQKEKEPEQLEEFLSKAQEGTGNLSGCKAERGSEKCVFVSVYYYYRRAGNRKNHS